MESFCDVSTSEALDLLKTAKVGTFLIRPSSSAGCLSISFVSASHRIQHTRVTRKDDYFVYEGRAYDDMQGVIQSCNQTLKYPYQKKPKPVEIHNPEIMSHNNAEDTFPSYWKNKTDVGLVDGIEVPLTNELELDHFQDIITRSSLHENKFGLKIEKLSRLENHLKFKEYCMTRSTTTSELQSLRTHGRDIPQILILNSALDKLSAQVNLRRDTNELYLFFSLPQEADGVDSKAIMSLKNRGFVDPPRGGTIFHESAVDAAAGRSEGTIFLVRVILGIPLRSTSNEQLQEMRLPPPITESETIRFHSVSLQTLSRQTAYVIFRTEVQCYPEYAFTFTRKSRIRLNNAK